MGTLVWAHRGASAYAPENTLEAYKLAIDMDADGIEIDVRYSKDKQIVVSHDDKIDYTSDGHGYVRDLTLKEIKEAFCWGRDPKRTADKYDYKTRYCTLDEVFELMKPSRLTVNVEIKDDGEEFCEEVYKKEVEHGMQGRVIYSAFNHHNLVNMRKLDPKAYIAPLYGDGIVQPWNYGALFGVSALHPNFHEIYNIGEEYIKNCTKNGILVNPWTVDREEDMKKLSDWGVNALITNRPDVAIGIVRK